LRRNFANKGLQLGKAPRCCRNAASGLGQQKSEMPANSGRSARYDGRPTRDIKETSHNILLGWSEPKL
jgi:hypothetical protein